MIYEIKYVLQDLSGNKIKDKTEWTGNYKNAMEVHELFLEWIYENTPYGVIELNVKRKEVQNNE